MVNAFKIIANGIKSIIAWNSEEVQLINLRASLTLPELMWGLVASGFFASEEVEKAKAYTRKNPVDVYVREGMSGCKDIRFFSIEHHDVLGEKMYFRRLRANLHVSCAGKLNEGFRMAIMDFLPVLVYGLDNGIWEYAIKHKATGLNDASKYAKALVADQKCDLYGSNGNFDAVESDEVLRIENFEWHYKCREVHNISERDMMVIEPSDYALDENDPYNPFDSLEILEARKGAVRKQELMDRFFSDKYVWILVSFADPMESVYLHIRKEQWHTESVETTLEEVLWHFGQKEDTPENRKLLYEAYEESREVVSYATDTLIKDTCRGYYHQYVKECRPDMHVVDDAPEA